MSDVTSPFGPEFVLGGSLYYPDLKFRFEVWSRTSPLAPQIVDQVYATWRRARRTNAPKKNQTVRIQYLG